MKQLQQLECVQTVLIRIEFVCLCSKVKILDLKGFEVTLKLYVPKAARLILEIDSR